MAKFDRELMQKVLEDPGKYSNEDILNLLEKGFEEEKKPEVVAPPAQTAPPQQVSVRLPNGQEVSGANYEEVNRKIIEAMTPAPAVNQPPAWDMEKFAKTFVQDPAEALNYLEESKYGVSIRKVMPTVIQGMAAMAQEVQDLKGRLLNQGVDPKLQPEVEKVIAEYHLPKTFDSQRAALEILKARGTVPEAKPVPPPRIPRSPVESEPDEASQMAMINGLNDAQVEELMVRAGLISSPVFTKRG